MPSYPVRTFPPGTTGSLGATRRVIGVPVLAGSAGYAFAEAVGWKFGLERDLKDARGFYLVIPLSVLIALGIQYSPISPMHALFWSAVINGVLAVPLMAVVLLLASDRKAMGQFTIGPVVKTIGWLTVALMSIAAILLFVAS